MTYKYGVVGQDLRVYGTFYDEDGVAIDASAATSKVIKHRAPTASIMTSIAATTGSTTNEIYADIPAATLTIEGTWEFMGEAVVSGKTIKTFGEIVWVLREGAPLPQN